MIANQTFGGDFFGLGDYLRRGREGVDPSQRVGWVEFRHLPTRRMDVAERIMEGTASLSYTRKPVFHLSISFAPGDPVSEALMKRVMVRTLGDLGLGEHQAVIVAHIDTDDPHVHAMVNRVHPETGVAWKGSWSRLRAEASLRQQELDEGLRVVPGWLARVPGHPELRPQPRLAHADQEFLREVQERAGPVLERAGSWSGVEAGLAEFGLSMRVNGRGMSITDGRRLVKASVVGRQFSRGKLEKRLGRYSDYSARVAVASTTLVRDSGGVSPAPVGIESKAEPQNSAASDVRPRFSIHVDGEIIGVWDSRGPQFFFADTRERAEAEMQRAEWLVARYPNIGALRCLRDMDGECRDARGLPRLPEENGRPVSTAQPVAVADTTVPQATPGEGRSAPAPAPDMVRGHASFLEEVRSQAGPALRLSASWAELEQSLTEVGLFLRVKGGGFVVTDGRSEVKASEVGREFSRFNLEKRLGRLPDHPVAFADEASALRAPAVQPESVTHADLPKERWPAAAPMDTHRPADAPRFTLYEEGGNFGVYDSALPQVFFAETRERALEEVERAIEIVAFYPNTTSMRHLREMDGAWRDARGLPRLPEPQGRTISVTWRGGVSTTADLEAHKSTPPTDAVGGDGPAAREPGTMRVPEHVSSLDQPLTDLGREEVAAPADHLAAPAEIPQDGPHLVAFDGELDAPDVDAAVRAFVALEQVRGASARARDLRVERTEAEQLLAMLRQQDALLASTKDDFSVTAESVYRNPSAAMASWGRLVHREGGDLEAARQWVSKNPELLGQLRTEPHPYVWGALAEKAGFVSSRAAREALPHMLRRAVQYAQAVRETAKPVEWTAPDRKSVMGREEVRSKAMAIVRDRRAEIETIEEAIRELGGVSGAERAVQRAFHDLSPAQRNEAVERITAWGVATGLPDTVAATHLAEVLARFDRSARRGRGAGGSSLGL